jgi:hypothetical protein
LPPKNAKGHFAEFFLKKHGITAAKTRIYNDILEQYFNVIINNL